MQNAKPTCRTHWNKNLRELWPAFIMLQTITWIKGNKSSTKWIDCISKWSTNSPQISKNVFYNKRPLFQNINKPLFVPHWYWERWGLTNLPDHDENLNVRYKIDFKLIKRLSVQIEIILSILQTTSIFVIVCVRLILTKVRIDRFTGPRGEIAVRYEFDFKLMKENRDYLSHFWVIFEATSKSVTAWVRLILDKVGVYGFAGPRREIDVR